MHLSKDLEKILNHPDSNIKDTLTCIENNYQLMILPNSHNSYAITSFVRDVAITIRSNITRILEYNFPKKEVDKHQKHIREISEHILLKIINELCEKAINEWTDYP